MSSSSDKASVGESGARPGPAPCPAHDVSFKFIITDDVQPGALTYCFDGNKSCGFEAHLHPGASIYLFVVHFYESREDDFDLFYWLIAAFKIPAEVRVKIQDTNASSKLQCFDVLHRVYHRHNEQLTLAMIKATLSEHSDELRQIINDYNVEK